MTRIYNSVALLYLRDLSLFGCFILKFEVEMPLYKLSMNCMKSVHFLIENEWAGSSPVSRQFQKNLLFQIGYS